MSKGELGHGRAREQVRRTYEAWGFRLARGGLSLLIWLQDRLSAPGTVRKAVTLLGKCDYATEEVLLCRKTETSLGNIISSRRWESISLGVLFKVGKQYPPLCYSTAEFHVYIGATLSKWGVRRQDRWASAVEVIWEKVRADLGDAL